MEADRVHSYLKIACSALGFEVGEVWITSHEIVQHDMDTEKTDSVDISDQKDYTDSSNISKVDETTAVNSSSIPKRKRKIHFLQLYTSKNLNSILGRRSISNRNIYKEGIDHVLSPLLVNVVADSSQIIWAHCQNVNDGLLFQTAVGVPVAKDAEGNMFIVVMFSPNNISSSTEAIEYLQYIGTFATSTTIPCLLPVVKDRFNTFQLTYSNPDTSISSLLSNSSLSTNGTGLKAQLISYDYKTGQDLLALQMQQDETTTKNQTNKILKNTPWLGADYSMQPQSFNLPNDDFQKLVDNFDSDVFDDASYGLWNTIMNASSSSNDITKVLQKPNQNAILRLPTSSSSALVTSNLNPSSTAMVNSSVVPTVVLEAQNLSSIRKDRLEEFASAFLGLSVFDAADVWVCVSRNGGVVEGLTHSFSVLVTQTNEGLNYFEKASQGCIVNPWNGAVGRAFWSGNAVWSSNKDIIVESPRAEAYHMAEITTTLAVPIFSDGAVMPSCVMCFYSLLRVDSVPFVLRFIQQALRLLWIGLDNIEPDERIARDLWKTVAPADIGEMAADIEMQSAFVSRKKRRMGQAAITDNINIHRLPNAYNENSDSGQVAKEMRNPNETNGTVGPLDNANSKHDENTATALAFLKSLNDMILSSLQGNSSSIAHRQFDLSKASIHSLNPLQPETIATLKDSLMHNLSKSTDTAKLKSTTIDRRHLSMDSTVDLKQSVIARTSPVDNVSVLTELLKSKTRFDESKDAYYDSSSINDHKGPKYVNEGDKLKDSVEIPLVTSENISASNKIKSSSSVDEKVGATIFSSKIKPDVPTSDFAQKSAYSSVINALNLVTSSDPITNFYQLPGMKPEYSSDVAPYCLPTSATFDPNIVNGMQTSTFNRNNNSKICEWPGCNKFPQGPTKYCISHGGGHRCQFPGCVKGARDKKWCTAHGGGKRCEIDGCVKAAVGSSTFCTAHGGGRRCSVNGCFKAAQSPTLFCVKHGGGKKCAFEDCDKVARGKTPYCAKHGGGVRCKIDGCTRVAIGKFHLCRAHGGKSQRAD